MLQISEILRLGFQLEKCPDEFYNIIPNIKAAKCLSWRGTIYDIELMGVIDKEIYCIGTAHKWYIIENNNIFPILNRQDLILKYPFLKYKNHLNFVYVKKTDFGYKIGKTKNIDRRNIFNIKVPFTVENVCILLTDDEDNLEQFLHDKFKEKRLTGEWFNLNQQDILKIISFNKAQDCFIRDLANLSF